MTDQTPEALIRGWAKAYRDTPEHRFPSDPHAEFFPIDLDAAADEIERLQGEAWKYLQECGAQARRAEALAKALERIATAQHLSRKAMQQIAYDAVRGIVGNAVGGGS